MTIKEKILLVHPEISHKKQTFQGVIENEPVELEYYMAMLKEEGYEVEIFDVSREKITLKEKVKQMHPDYFYICGRLKQENFMKNYLRFVKQFDKKIVTIVSGLHVQKNAERFFMPEVDYILTTFDIFTILPLLKFEKEKKGCAGKRVPDSFSEINGLCYRKDGYWLSNPQKPFDINRLPMPDRSYFYEHPDHYCYLDMRKCAQVRTAYSCAFHCNFCYRNTMNCGTYTARDIELVVEEIAGIDCDNSYIIDDDFLLDKVRIKRFIELIRERRIHKHYVCYGRADFIVKNKALMKELKSIGFRYVITGIEATTNRALKNYNKKTDMNVNVECIRFMQEIGINCVVMLITDLDFRAKDFREMYNFVRDLNVRHMAVSIYTPIPGTELYEQYKDKLLTDNPENFDYMHLVTAPRRMGIRQYYFHYYLMITRMFLLSYKRGVYDFLDYKEYLWYAIRSAIVSRGMKDM